MNKNKLAIKFAFTMSEILITLGIIGIIAALTLSSIINNAQERQFHSKFRKAYSQFAQANQRIYYEDGENFVKRNWLDIGIFYCKLVKQMKVIKSGINCNIQSNIEKIYNSQLTSVSRKSLWHTDNSWYDKQKNPRALANEFYKSLSFITNDEVLYMLMYSNLDVVVVDVNGYKKPNMIGKDIYYFCISPNSYIPTFYGCKVPGSQNWGETIYSTNYKQSCESGMGWGCSVMVINNELK